MGNNVPLAGSIKIDFWIESRSKQLHKRGNNLMLKAIHILPGTDDCVEMKNKAGHLWPGGKKKEVKWGFNSDLWYFYDWYWTKYLILF